MKETEDTTSGSRPKVKEKRQPFKLHGMSDAKNNSVVEIAPSPFSSAF
jgi:hypothetical protein